MKDAESFKEYRKRSKLAHRLWKQAQLRGEPGVAGEVERFERGLMGREPVQPEAGPPSNMLRALSEDELALGRRINHADDGLWSDSEGTWTNIAGEVVKIAGPNGEDFS